MAEARSGVRSQDLGLLEPGLKVYENDRRHPLSEMFCFRLPTRSTSDSRVGARKNQQMPLRARIPIPPFREDHGVAEVVLRQRPRDEGDMAPDAMSRLRAGTGARVGKPGVARAETVKAPRRWHDG